MKKVLSAALILSIAVFVGCGGSSGGSSTPPTTPTLVSISVAPSAPSITVGTTQQFTATGNYSDGSTKSLTSSANWLSSASSVATINTTGLASAVSGGTSTITASLSGVTGSASLTVANPLVSIAVTPATASVSPIAPNNTQQFTATGTYTDHSTQNITTSVTWTASNGATITQGGLATAVAPGSVTITASSSGVSGTASLTVSNPLASIAVTPANSTVGPATKPQFTALGTYFDHTSNDITSQVSWTSSNTAAATISNSPGTQGVATAITGGQTTITATCTPPSTACPTGNPISSSTSLTVTNAVITSIAVTPTNSVIPLGLSQQYDAVATFSDGSSQDVTNIVTWTTSDSTKVTITTSGLARAVAVTASPVTVTATSSNNVTGSTTVTVNTGSLQSVTIRPANVTQLAQGTQQQYSAIATFSNGSTLDVTNQVTWAISPTGYATVAQKTGLVQALPVVTNQAVTLTATLQNAPPASLGLTITNATPTSITVTPITATIPPGVYQPYHATAAFNDGTSQDVTLPAAWTTSNSAYAVVNYPGRILSVAGPSLPNTVTVSATFGGITSPPANLTVTNETLVSIALSPTSANLTPGATTNLQATGTFSAGSTAFLAGLATWGSSSTSVATVANGLVLGQSAGTANITASYLGHQGSAPVLVTPSPLTQITVCPFTSTPCQTSVTSYVGLTVPFVAIGTAGSNQIVLTNSATWASSLSPVATVSNAYPRNGVTTTLSAGSTTISAVFAGITGTSTLNVSSATLVSISITPSTAQTISPGSTLQFTATGTFSDGNTVLMSTQVTWSSSNPAAAPIVPGGLVSGAAAGVTNIQATFLQPGQTTPVQSNVVQVTVN